MIGVQCQLVICRGHIRASKGTFQIFFCLTVLWPIDIKSNFALWSSFKVEFERVVNGLGGHRSKNSGPKFIMLSSVNCFIFDHFCKNAFETVDAKTTL